MVATGGSTAADQAFAAEVARDMTLFARSGAQLIMSKGEIGGAPGGERDDVCTSAGLAKIADRLSTRAAGAGQINTALARDRPPIAPP